jgi:hypothetical protein
MCLSEVPAIEDLSLSEGVVAIGEKLQSFEEACFVCLHSPRSTRFLGEASNSFETSVNSTNRQCAVS